MSGAEALRIIGRAIPSLARPIVLMTAPRLASAGADLLAAAGCDLRLLASADPDSEMTRALATESVAAVISRTLAVRADHIASCPTLRVISRHGVGYNNVDVEAATARGIPVTIADGANGQSVAELAIGLMLAVARRIPQLDAGVHAGGWDRSGAGTQLAGRRLGLVACGAIGGIVARIAQGIGMEVMAYDPYALSGSGPSRAANLGNCWSARTCCRCTRPRPPRRVA